MSDAENAMDETVRVRIAGETDAGAIRALTREAYAKWVEVIGREPLPMQADYADALRKNRFDLLYVGERLAALIETVRQGDHLLIENVAVLPTYQGRGFGGRLLDLAEELAATSQCKCVRLYTNKLFVANIRLYEARGYRIEREEEFKGGTVVHMMKPLAPR